MHTAPTTHSRRFTLALATPFWLVGMLIVWVPRVEQTTHLLANLAVTYLMAWSLLLLLSAQPRVTIARRFLLMTGSIVGCVALLELPVLLHMVDYRLVLRDPNFDRKNPWRAHPLNLPDPELVQIFSPHQHITGTQPGGDIARIWNLPALGEYEYDYRTDQQGFRNRTSLTRADVVVLGDSIVWAPFVSADEMMTSVLQALRGGTVVNLAQRGYGPQQELAVLRRFGLPFEPKVCVWTFFEGNDIGDMRRYDQTMANWDAHLAKVQSFRKRSFTRNALILAKETFRPYAGKSVPYGDAAATFKPAGGQPREMYFFYGGIDEILRGPQAPEMMRDTMAGAYALCAERDIKLLFVFVPTKFRVYGPLCELAERSVMRSWNPGDLPQQLATLMEDISPEIGFVDLTARFAAEAEQGAMLYWPDDTHLSVTGNRLAAEIIHKQIGRISVDALRETRLIGATSAALDE